MSQDFDNYLTTYYDHTATPRALAWNALSVPYHHGSHFPRNKAANILEVGPGKGDALTMLQKQGYTNVRAVDVSSEVVGHCNRKYPMSTDLVPDTTTYLGNHAEEFDLILMLHVVEHLSRDSVISTLQAARGALKEGGKLIVEVPNFANPIIGPKNFSADFTHRIAYSSQSLEQVLRIAGFSVISVYPCKVVRKNLLRFLQRTIQDSIELLVGVVMRAYSPTQSTILAVAIGACATK